jgi:glycosyltransferase involved in cell wall biosynthesis
MKKTIAFVGSVGIPARYGGFETLVEQLSKRLVSKHEIFVFCSSKSYSKSERKKDYQSAVRYFIPLKANGFSSIFYDLISLIRAIPLANNIIILGGSASFFLPLFKPFLRKKNLIFHPDGTEWTRLKWGIVTRTYLKLSIYAGCKTANKIIIDNAALNKLYRKFNKKCVQCSYGGDQYQLKDEKKDYWLSIARAEPENNLELIAETFSNLPSEKWRLISNFSASAFGRKLQKKYQQFSNIQLVHSTYNKEEIEKHLNCCKGYIHGHSAGGTNPTLASAMWLNKALLCHNNTFNKNTTQGYALFFNTTSELGKLLLNDNLNTLKLARHARKIAQEKYTWNTVSDVYESLFI